MLAVTVGLVAAAIVAAVVAHCGFARFRRRAQVYLERCGDIVWRHDTRSGAIFAVLGYDVNVDLLATYVYRVRQRCNESRLLADLAAALRERVPPVPAPPAQLVRDRIFPLLRRTSALPSPAGYVPANHLMRSAFDEEISIVYVIDGGHRFTFVTEGMCAAWGLDGPALHQLALVNLRARTAHLLAELGGPQTQYVSLDGLDATRVLVADLIVPGGIAQPVLAIPHEHACLIADAPKRAQLAAHPQATYLAAELPLTPRLYRLTAEGLRPEPA